MEKEKDFGALSIFLYFFHISWFTFGGGWSIVAQMQKDFVDKRKMLTEKELLDIVSVGRSLPGTMIGNVAFLFGYRQCGILGGFLAAIGMVLPPMLILLVLTFCYGMLKDNIWVAKMLSGVRAAVAPIMFSAAWKLKKAAFTSKLCYLIFLGACILSAVFDVSSIMIIFIGIAAGILMGQRGERQEC